MKASGERRLPRKRTVNDERGQAIIEFLPVLFILLILVFSVIDFSRAIWQLQVMSGLSREGSNMASRTADSTGLMDAANAVVNDGAPLQLSLNGRVIVTAVINNGGSMQIYGQAVSGALGAASRVGTGVVGSPATIPATTPLQVPQNGNLIYVTEVFCSFSPITPLGAFVTATGLPTTMYDVAYF